MDTRELPLSEAKAALLKKWRSGKTTPSHSVRHHELSRFSLSSTQRRIWFFEQLFPGTPTYNMHSAMCLKGSLNIAALEYAFNEVVKRQSTLRTIFTLYHDQPVQQILPDIELLFEIIDVDNKDSIALEELLIDKSRITFNLTEGPLWRIHLLQVDTDSAILLVVMHHLIADGWSLAVLFEEVNAIYAACIQNIEHALPVLSTQYQDFIVWQEEQSATANFSDQIAYWKKNLIYDKEPTQLSSDYTRSTVPSYAGKRSYFSVSKELTAQLIAMTKVHQVSIFMVLIAVFNILVFRYTGKTALTIGSPIANRKRPEWEKLIGFFANTLVIQTDIKPQQTFSMFLQQVKQITTQAYAHQDLPFEKLVEIVQPNRDLTGSPLFNMVLVYQNTPAVTLNLLGVKASSFPVHNHTAKFDLLLTSFMQDEKLECAFEYSTDLFSSETIAQYARDFIALLKVVVQNYDVLIDKIDFLTQEEKHRLITVTNPESMTYPKQNTLVQLFERTVGQFSNKAVLWFNQEYLSYQVLNKRANQVAHQLLKAGVKPNDLVGLAMDVSFDLIIGILGILKSGGAYVPLDLNSPIERIVLIQQDSALRWIVCSSNSVNKLPSNNCSLILIDVVTHDQPVTNPNLYLQPDNLAYVIYTSGSTGKPKGVLVGHCHVARLFLATQSFFTFTDADIFCLFHSYAFDFSVWEIWGALVYGGSLVLVPEEIRKQTEEFYNLLIDKKVTVLNQTPSAFYQLITVDTQRTIPSLHDLRFIIFGGAALKPYMLKTWMERYGDDRPKLINMYGITETTVHVTYRCITKEDLSSITSPIGRPILDLKLYVMDNALNLVPQGAVGELYVAGGGVTYGYLKRDALTQERFILNPFDKEHFAVLYKTGDLVRMNKNNELEYIGRADQQVKIRGYRIELGEIESLVMQHSAVNQCLVLPYQFSQEDTQLVCYVILKNNNGEILESTSDESIGDEEQVDEWNMVFDEYYSSSVNHFDPSFNISGWISSYTREMIPDIEMKEWVEQTVKLILSLKPKSVLEMGCGTGLLLSRIAPKTKCYYGTDLSATAINYIQNEIIKNNVEFGHVILHHQAAEDFLLPVDMKFDTFILNSVCQYFPSIDYLINVIKHIIPNINSNGYLFIGDIRSLELDDIFHSSVVLHNSLAERSVSDIRYATKIRTLQDTELRISHKFFYELEKIFPEISHVEILMKTGKFKNELNCFRYDVVIYINHPVVSSNVCYIENKPTVFEELSLKLQDKKELPLLIENISNSRIIRQAETYLHLHQSIETDSLADLQLRLSSIALSTGLDPFDFYKLSQECGISIRIQPSSSGNIAQFNVLFLSTDFETCPIKIKPPYYSTAVEISSSPTKAHFYKNWQMRLRRHLSQKLPDYMIPTAFIEIAHIPLNINGKVDTKALPNPFEHDREVATNFIPLETMTEKIIAQVYTELLGHSILDKNANFFTLGGHSLLATRLVFHLQKMFNIAIPLRLILLKPKIKDLAEAIDSFKFTGAFDKAITQNNLQLDKEVFLDATITVTPSLKQPRGLYHNILLTGATGFIGIFLLHELLENTSASIHCLVRGASIEQARLRLQEQFEQYQLWKDHYALRINIVLGDLASPYFGLDKERWNDLSQLIDIIYHNGALVNFVYPYESLKMPNVIGTTEVLRLSSTYILKPVEFISTLFVFSKKDEEQGLIQEGKMPVCWQGLQLGYTQSKWVAEQVIQIARQRGLLINIYRLGRISGNTQTGASQTNDFFWETIRVGLKKKYLPKVDTQVDITPVDFVCRAIVTLSQQGYYGKNYHIKNACSMSFNLFTSVLKDKGYQIEDVTYLEWQDRLLKEAHASETEDDSHRLLPVISQLSTEIQQVNFDDTYTQFLLKQIGIHFPSVQAVMETYIKYFISIGYFPVPNITDVK